VRKWRSSICTQPQLGRPHCFIISAARQRPSSAINEQLLLLLLQARSARRLCVARLQCCCLTMTGTGLRTCCEGSQQSAQPLLRCATRTSAYYADWICVVARALGKQMPKMVCMFGWLAASACMLAAAVVVDLLLAHLCVGHDSYVRNTFALMTAGASIPLPPGQTCYVHKCGSALP
jgi:hypothetical protein